MPELEKLIEKANWKVDYVHSKIRFSAKHMVISQVEGQFNEYEIDAFSEKDDLSDTEVEVRILVNSLDTKNEDRNNHLRSPDFFEVDKYPNITFQSTSIKKLDDGKYKLYGDLTIKDITKPIELDLSLGGKIKDPWGNTRIGFNLNGSLNRFDYNLKWNNLLEMGGAVVGKIININCDIELIQTQ
jgi:polyisoprenoid-binding protein YceI